jgi:hypothetical protein
LAAISWSIRLTASQKKACPMQGGDLSLQDRRVVGQTGEEAVDQPTLVGQAAKPCLFGVE